MKKRLLAALLSLAMVLAIALPAFAEPDPAMPAISAQPVSVKVNSNSIGVWVLEVTAEIPNGDPIGYQWYQVDPKGDIPVGRNCEHINSYVGDHVIDLWDLIKGVELYCVVYNSGDSTAEEGPHRAVSETVSVRAQYRAQYIIRSSMLAILGLPIDLMRRWFGEIGYDLMLPYIVLVLAPLVGALWLLTGWMRF